MATETLTGYGDALADALGAYRRLFMLGCAHSLRVGLHVGDLESWEFSWQQNVGGLNWIKISIVQRDLHTLGRFALRTLGVHEQGYIEAAALAAAGTH